MTLNNIISMVVIVKLDDGRVMQMQTSAENRSTIIQAIGQIEGGIKIFDKPHTDIDIVKGENK